MAGVADFPHLLNSFQRALAVASQDPGWRDHLDDHLGGLRRAFAEHVGATEGPDGLYHELIDHAPRLAAGVDELVRDHAALRTAMEGLRDQVAMDGGDVTARDLDRVRGWAGDLMREFYAHRQRGADLVYEAYGTDIGGET